MSYLNGFHEKVVYTAFHKNDPLGISVAEKNVRITERFFDNDHRSREKINNKKTLLHCVAVGQILSSGRARKGA